ncbi:hypothetical protein D4764_21G0008280, partial [Takifugu flavidus]
EAAEELNQGQVLKRSRPGTRTGSKPEISPERIYKNIRVLKHAMVMERMRTVFFVSVCLSMMTSLCQGQRSLDQQPLFDVTTKELADTLQEFLDQDDSSIGHSLEKKASMIPRCDVGERCALKHGPRIGRLCDCLRGAACNTFFLRCY